MMEPTSRHRQRLDRSLNGILALIGIEFFLGIWLSLFGVFPSNPTLAAGVTDLSAPVLIAHIVLGLLMGLGALLILLLAARDPYRNMRWFALGGLLGVAIAGISGSAFVGSGYANNDASFAMAVGFAIALTSYYEGLVAIRGRPLPTEATSVVSKVSDASS